MLQTAVCVESPSHRWRLSPCFQQGKMGRIEGTRVSVECEIPVVKVFTCVRLWLADSHVSGRSFDTDCPIVVTGSASPGTTAFI